MGTRKDSPLTRLKDTEGQRIAAGPKAAYLFRLCAADLMRNGIDVRKQKVLHQPQQGAVPVAVLSMGMADVALLENRSAAQWKKDGHRIVHTSVSQPFFPLLASPRLSAAQVESMQKALLALDRDKPGQEALDALTIEGFDIGSEARLRALPAWLDKAGK